MMNIRNLFISSCFLLSSACSHAINVSINKIEIHNQEVFAVVSFKNDTRNPISLNRKNICRESPFLHRSLFDVLDNGSEVPYLGALVNSPDEFVILESKSEIECVFNLSMNYKLDISRLQDYKVRFRSTKGPQATSESILKSSWVSPE